MNYYYTSIIEAQLSICPFLTKLINLIIGHIYLNGKVGFFPLKRVVQGLHFLDLFQS